MNLRLKIKKMKKGEKNIDIDGTKNREIRRDRALKVFQFLTFVLFFVGIYFLFHLSQNGRNIYFSENALNPAMAENKYNFQEHNEAKRFTEEYRIYQKTLFNQNNSIDSIADWLSNYSEKIGFETYTHQYHCKKLNRNFTNVISILRSTSCGKESMALSTTYDLLTQAQMQQNDAVSSIGVSFSLLNMIGKSGWLARDIFMITTYSECKEEGLNNFLEKYYEIKSTDEEEKNLVNDKKELVRGGIIQNALHVEFFTNGFDQLILQCDGMQLPNLDLVNSVGYIASQERLNFVQFHSDEKISPLLKFSPKYKFNTLLEFIFNCALGVPTSSHSIFNKFSIDAVSLSVRQNVPTYSHNSIVHLGRTLEGSFRSLNNLLEHLHQSFYFYILPSVGRYIPIGDYMICFAMIFPLLFINALVLYFSKERKEMTKAVSFFIITEFVCLLIFLVPYFFQKNLSGEELWKMTLYTSLSLVSILFLIIFPLMEYLFFLPSSLQKNSKDFKEHKDKGIKVVCSMFVCLYVACMSLVNFSFSFLSGLLIISSCIFFTPTRSRIFNLFQVLFITLFSPFSLLYYLSYYLGYSSYFSLFDIIFQQFKIHQNFVYPFLCLVYLPVNLLFIKMMIQ
eukprot:TRINITY_DN3518_c0_g1_i2.p1 TRINITY_DN3518_c0_g1~~TRINITY_DN3518_c0_g1_i2.p1  ORF type:complete len:621 (-),score=97.36 TRINITY_DN3518_c0_g1_i2:325-2187(-)